MWQHRLWQKGGATNLTWLEEPVPAENVDSYRKIAEETSTPISAGENIYLAYGFRRLLEIGGVDVLCLICRSAGGLERASALPTWEIFINIPFAPHMVASFLGAMACAHVCVSVPNFMIMEGSHISIPRQCSGKL